MYSILNNLFGNIIFLVAIRSQRINISNGSIPNKNRKMYGEKMDRRQKKSRLAIFKAFTELLSKREFNQITVGEIIDRADVGRATFYAHFETKDYLLKELCEELFCHVFDATKVGDEHHKHIFDCDEHGSVFLHLLKHLQKNDNNVLELLVCQNNEIFTRYFKEYLKQLVENQIELFNGLGNKKIPKEFLVNHVSSSYVETVKWWIDNGKKESAEELLEYFYAVLK